MDNKDNVSGGFLSIVPLLVFVLTFLGAGIYFDDFYALPSPIAVFFGVVVAYLIFKGNLEEKTSVFLKGCSDQKILTMCIIYLLAGAFATVSKASGSVDSIVNLGLAYISPQYLIAGIFVIASFLSFASGTSVGAIVTLAPIVLELAEKSNLSIGIAGAALLCGAMFGDNLSFISDTTIAATQSLGTTMKAKFQANFRLALPSAIVALIGFMIVGLSQDLPTEIHEVGNYNIGLILPYLLVIILAVSGVNVFVTLFFGVLVSGGLGLWNGSFDGLGFSKKIYEGFTGMSEIFYLSLLTGGLAALVERAGGITYLLGLINKLIRSKRSALLGIGGLVSVTNLCVANNTISILISGNIAKKINDKYNIAPKDSASVLDIFACYVQGVIPYGAQILLLISFSGFKIDYIELIANAYYLHLLLAVTVIYIVLRSFKVKH